MAASSNSNIERWKHDVFLSFRGPDTRNTFTAHLYQALRSKGLNVFIDNELQRGQVITSQLLRVIKESRISIILLSQNYASSSFCLDELEKIMECRLSKGQTVYPVFYHVDPTEVEEQSGSFGLEFAKLVAQLNNHSNYWKLFPSIVSSFLRHATTSVNEMRPTFDDVDEKRNNDEEATTRIEKWRLALTEVATLSGWHLRKGDHESNIIQDIIKKVLKKLNYTPLHAADHPVGLTSRVECILEEFNMESHDVCMIGLYGMGGVGKTTTAIALYNTFASQFEFDGCCFLSKVRENSKPPNGLAELQQTLLSQILGDQEHLIESSEKGVELIKRRLRSLKVLVFIDDVDHLEQLRKLAGGLEWFGRGSIIIITTRNSHLLENHGVTIIHEIKELAFHEALQLFSWYAFKEPQPDETYKELSSEIISYTRGLPLALIVLGSSLYKRSALEWDDVLKKLKRCPNEEIDEVLKVSYDSLDSEEKTIFLDIAFFFKGKQKNEVIKFLDVCGLGALSGIQRLIENSLVYVDDRKETLEMHDLLEAMGNKIALQGFCRLFIREREDILRMFVKDESAYDVEILVLDLYGEEEVSLKWLENLTKLRALVIRNGSFIKMPKKLPKSIKWLEWHNSCLKSIPSGFLPPNLVAVVMPGNIMADMPKARKFTNLIRMDFRGSKHLKKMVDFSSVPNLQVLLLIDCRKLKTIHKSVGSLKNLKGLVLEGCRSLTSVPNLIENESLEFINLSYCQKLENIPNLPTTVTQLKLEYSGIKEIPLFIGNLINIQHIWASNCENLIRVSNLHTIELLELRNCPNLSQFPEIEKSSFSLDLTSTTHTALDLSKNEFVYLPVNSFKFSCIDCLCLNDCEWLVEIPELPHSVMQLLAVNCKSLVRFSQFQFDHFTGDFSNCHKMAENELQSWKEMDYPPQGQYEIMLPGNEIPEWFNYAFNCEGITHPHSFKLPSSLFNANLIGVACAIIVQDPMDSESFKLTINEFSLDPICLILEPAHMYLNFYSSIVLPKLSEAEEISCKFECDKEDALKRAGLHFYYRNC